MIDPRRPATRFPGFLLALLPIAGLATGTVWRQPSLGLVIGLGIAMLLVLLSWLLGRR